MHLFELPTFEATWWPLRMETIPGSGEAITVAVMARAASGQSQIRQSVQPAVLISLFGQGAGKGVQAMVGTTVLSVQAQLDGGVRAEAVELPFGGFDFGHGRDCAAHDLSEVFDIAVRLSAVFGFSPFGHRQAAAESSREAFEDWASRVRAELLVQEERLAVEPEEFNVPVRLARKRVQFGFLRSGYAANFAVLRPGKTSGDTRSLKVKLFDLEALRREQVVPISRTEVLVGCPADAALSPFSGREVEGFHSSMEFLEGEAQARGVELVRCATHAAAAEHIRARIAA